MQHDRFLSHLLALTLALALCVPALAAGSDSLTRGSFVAALFELDGAKDTQAHQTHFSDVPADGALAQAVCWAVDAGVVNGYGDGRFGPDDGLTREQMATMLYRRAQALCKGFRGMWMFRLDYPDADRISSYADEAMHWAVMHGILPGTDKGLEPQAYVTEDQLPPVLERWRKALTGEPAELDYLTLVNKLNALPEGWEDAIETVKITNSVGSEVAVEKQAYAAYQRLREDLEKNDGVFVDLDSAYRSVEKQQAIMDDFTERFGADYAAKTVAQPGYSEHHTGIALDLYLIIDGKDVDENEDMMQYPEIWEKIHAKLAQYGFILRYPDGKEHITGYGYEPWHIRYVGDAETAREIASQPGLTLEEYLAGRTAPEVSVDHGESGLYTKEDIDAAMVQVKCRFASFAGCELHSLRYAGDACDSEENVRWLNSLDEGRNYVQAIEILTDFHSPVAAYGAWETDREYTDYQWWLARAEGGGWQLLTWGY